MGHRRVSLVLLGVVAIALVMSWASPARAQGEAYQGVLTQQGEPVPGVEIVVSTEDGEEVGRAITNDAGEWRVDLPGPGAYLIELQEDTLPEGVQLTDPDANPIENQMRFSGRQARITFNLNEAIAADTLLDRLPQRLLTGLRVGLIIAMTSVGLSLVFGTMGLINFAHGELVTFGAITAFYLNTGSPGLPIAVATVIAIIAGAVLSGTLEVSLFRRLERRRITGFQFLVVSIGLAILLQNLLLVWFGTRRAQYAIGPQAGLKLGPFTTNLRDALIIGISVAALIAVGLMLQKTRVGKAMRAISDNRDLAESSGIDVARVVFMIWIMGGGLAALGGVFLGLASSVEYQMGFRLLLLMFAAVILGGLGTAYGAMVGGLVVGVVSELSTLWLRPELKSVWALAILIIVLLVRPQGILGIRERFG